jgi:ABC-2 type transport system permease protein
VLWLIEEMMINMDSLSGQETALAIAQPLNLQDQLFTYGIRVNDNLVMDLQAAPIPIVTGMVGDKPQQQLFPWYFFPLLNPTATHPIVHNLNAIKCEFASSMDTIETPGVRKTILLTTSQYSKKLNSPVRVSLNILKQEPDPTYFNQGNLPIAVLLEGTFPSLYSRRVPAELIANKSLDFRDSSVENRMIVISDGDIISNYVSKKGSMYPLGFDRFTNQVYGNKNFILNCVDYLCDQENIVSLRGKEFKIRMLDKAKAENMTYAWSAMLLPLLLILIYGIVHNYLRKRKYGR